jgi:ABC-type lipoprotein release transport system permease subunit
VVPTASFDSLPIFYLPYGYYRAHPDLKQGYGFWWFRLKHGAADIPAFQAAADRVVEAAGAESGQAGLNAQSQRTAKVQRAIRPQATALYGFAILAALAGLLVVGQALARQLAVDAIDYPALRAMGMSPRQLLAVALARVGIVGGGGAVLGAALAIATSSLMPIGPARVAEPNPGVAVNAAVVVIGAIAAVGLLLVRMSVPAWRAGRVRGDGAAVERASRLADGLARAGVPAPPVVGVRMALESGRGRTAVPVRSAVVGTAVAVAAVAGAFTFNTNLDRLVTTPRLYGWSWDVATGVGFFPLPEDVQAELVADPNVAGVAAGQYGGLTIDGRPVDALAIDQVGGAPVFPTLLEGRAPSGPAEIVLGSRTLRRVGKSLGDQVRVESATGTHTLRIVGRAVFPKLGGANLSTTGLGEGAAVTAVHAGPIDEEGTVFHSIALVRFEPGVDPATALAGVRRTVSDGRFEGCPSALCLTNAVQQRPGDIENYARVRGTPLVLAALLVVMALGALTHTLVSSIRRRRRDIAVLKTLGFRRGQVSATTAWQATVLASVALLVGLPVGVAVGRIIWMAFAHNLGVSEAVRTPTLAVLLAVPATVLLANLIAAIPALSAARTHPAVVLRTE